MDTSPQLLTRRSFNKGLLLSFGALLASCTPVKILLKAYPEEYKTSHGLQDEMLRAFILTIVPGADKNTPKMTEIYYDHYYPFASYVPFFLSDLDGRAKKLFSGRSFLELTQTEKEKTVYDGLHNGDASAQRLYRGAIYMTRANIYAGIYDDNRGCPHIDFHGKDQDFDPDKMYYKDAKHYFAPQISLSGNPA